MKKTFKFLPGHRNLIMNVAKCVHEEISSKESKPENTMEHLLNQMEPPISNVLKEFIQTALVNDGKSANLNRYSDIMQSFSTYIYLLCGRQCYEVLCNNLPMPAASTVGEEHLELAVHHQF